MSLSVVMICHNEEANLPRTLASLAPLLAEPGNDLIVVDSGSTDQTAEIARAHGAKVYVEPWKGFAQQKNSALDKASGDWILSLDADEALEPALVAEINATMRDPAALAGYWMPRRNVFMGRVIRHGVWGNDNQLRLFRRGVGRFGDRIVHEAVTIDGPLGTLHGALIHYTCPDIATLIAKFNRYSSLAAEMAVAKAPRRFSIFIVLVMPLARFFKFYVLRLGFLDGREGFLLNLYFAFYVSLKYAKAWELSRGLATPAERDAAR